MGNLDPFEQSAVEAGLSFARLRRLSKSDSGSEDIPAFADSLIGSASSSPRTRLEKLASNICNLSDMVITTVNAPVTAPIRARTAQQTEATLIAASGANGLGQAAVQSGILRETVDTAVGLNNTTAELGAVPYSQLQLPDFELRQLVVLRPKYQFRVDETLEVAA